MQKESLVRVRSDVCFFSLWGVFPTLATFSSSLRLSTRATRKTYILLILS